MNEENNSSKSFKWKRDGWEIWLSSKKGLSSKVGDWLEEFRWKRWSVGEDSGEVVGILTDEALSEFKVGE